VSTSGNLYPYKSIMDTLTGFGRDALKSHMQAAMFYKDEMGKMDYPNPLVKFANQGWKERFDLTAGSKSMEVEGALFADCFQFSH